MSGKFRVHLRLFEFGATVDKNFWFDGSAEAHAFAHGAKVGGAGGVEVVVVEFLSDGQMFSLRLKENMETALDTIRKERSESTDDES